MSLPDAIMNKPVMAVLVLTIIAVTLLALYSFGPLAQHRAHSRLNPASLEPSAAGGAAAQGADTARVTFRNRDVRENYYAVAFPGDWHIGAGTTPGSYAVSFAGGTCTIELMDVPDNTTLELYVLSQEEPRLRRTATAYERIDYQRLEVGGADAYELTYGSKVGPDIRQTARAYIAGPDMAGVVTFAAKENEFALERPAFASVLRSFRWENQ
jgi:hypothetical protein